MIKSLRAALRWIIAAVAALMAPALAALASAALYFTLYGVRADPFFVLQLYAGFFIVLNIMLAPALARGRSAGDVALTALIASAASIGAFLAARMVFPPWPPAPLLRDLLFVGGSALIAMVSFWLSALLA